MTTTTMTTTTRISCAAGSHIDEDTNLCKGCKTGEYAATPNSLRCLPWTDCETGQVEAQDSATARSNRQCTSPRECGPDQWESGRAPDGQRLCEAVKDCYEGEYVQVDNTGTSDRICGSCDGNDSYSDSVNAKACDDVGFCDADHFVSTPAKLTSDLVCRSVCNGSHVPPYFLFPFWFYPPLSLALPCCHGLSLYLPVYWWLSLVLAPQVLSWRRTIIARTSAMRQRRPRIRRRRRLQQ